METRRTAQELRGAFHNLAAAKTKWMTILQAARDARDEDKYRLSLPPRGRTRCAPQPMGAPLHAAVLLDSPRCHSAAGRGCLGQDCSPGGAAAAPAAAGGRRRSEAECSQQGVGQPLVCCRPAFLTSRMAEQVYNTVVTGNIAHQKEKEARAAAGSDAMQFNPFMRRPTRAKILWSTKQVIDCSMACAALHAGFSCDMGRMKTHWMLETAAATMALVALVVALVAALVAAAEVCPRPNPCARCALVCMRVYLYPHPLTLRTVSRRLIPSCSRLPAAPCLPQAWSEAPRWRPWRWTMRTRCWVVGLLCWRVVLSMSLLRC